MADLLYEKLSCPGSESRWGSGLVFVESLEGGKQETNLGQVKKLPRDAALCMQHIRAFKMNISHLSEFSKAGSVLIYLRASRVFGMDRVIHGCAYQ